MPGHAQAARQLCGGIHPGPLSDTRSISGLLPIKDTPPREGGVPVGRRPVAAPRSGVLVFGGDGGDGLTGDSAVPFAAGDATGAGDDVLEGGLGFDFATGSAIGAGDDKITGGSADDIRLVGDSSSTGPVTEAGDDVIKGRDGSDTLFGDNINFDGDQTVGTMGGEDKLNGDDGDHT